MADGCKLGIKDRYGSEIASHLLLLQHSLSTYSHTCVCLLNEAQSTLKLLVYRIYRRESHSEYTRRQLCYGRAYD